MPGPQGKGIGGRAHQQRGADPVIEELVLHVLPGGCVVFVDIEVKRRPNSQPGSGSVESKGAR